MDATGLIILPGVIDVHVHLREPGATYKEDFLTGTAAAAAGGVTSIFDMPNNVPPTKDIEALGLKVRAASKKALVDYGFYGLITAGNSADIRPLAKAGVIGFKWYMAETTGDQPSPPDPELLADLRIAAEAKRRTSVHAEDGSMVKQGIKSLRESGRRDALAHYESRPENVEQNAVRHAIALAKAARADLHIAHLSSRAGVREVEAAKKRKGGPRRGRRPGWLTAETCPQYLLLDTNDYGNKGPLMKVNPSVKRKQDRLALWEAVNDGTVDMIATDHAPHSLAEKTLGDSIFDMASGFPGLETSVPLMLTCVNQGKLSLAKYVQLTSMNPAIAWGVYPQKGSLSIGADADFTIVDMRLEGRIDPATFYSKTRFSPFEGFKVKGRPVYTIVRGSVVMDHGFVETSSRGAMISPAPNSSKVRRE